MQRDPSLRRFLCRPPRPALRPFIRVVWASAAKPAGVGVDTPRLERVLPTGRSHLVFRMTEEPLRVLGGDATEVRVSGALVGGARAGAYLRDVSRPSPTFGADLLPGAATLLFGAPADVLAERHTPLVDLWGAEAERAHAWLAAACSLEEGLERFETLLAGRLMEKAPPHPVVAHAIRRFSAGAAVGEVVQASGYSHRRFIALFREAVGLTPKVYCRVMRLQDVLHRLETAPGKGWATLALEAGYSDQAHFNREFRELTGVTPGEYRALAPAHAHHVPVLERAR